MNLQELQQSLPQLTDGELLAMQYDIEGSPADFARSVGMDEAASFILALTKELASRNLIDLGFAPPKGVGTEPLPSVPSREGGTLPLNRKQRRLQAAKSRQSGSKSRRLKT